MFGYYEIQELSKKNPTELCHIMYKHKSDKSSFLKHHNYSLFYDKIFSEWRNKELKILEIGIGSLDPNIPSNMCGGELGKIYRPGASVRGWLEYFPKAKVFCCDIDKDVLDLNEDRVTTFYLDQTSEESINKCLEGILKEDTFDIIIDDGLHWFPTNCNVMHKLLPKLNKGGYYIIEDIVHYQFNYRYLEVTALTNTTYQYIRIPNEHNKDDNNIFIVKK